MVRNLILNALPDHEFSFLSRHSKFEPLEVVQVLYEPYVPIQSVYFLAAGTACTFTAMQSGILLANNIAGREGFLPMPIFLESDDMPVATTLMTVAGGAWVLEASFLRRHMGELKCLRTVLNKYATAQMVQVMQNAGCGRLHHLEERLSCWLLMISDRVGAEFKITHEMLAEMLGSRRATVTTHAERMQRSGIIKYAYGRVQIVNRARLERAACECYSIEHRTFTNFLRFKFM